MIASQSLSLFCICLLDDIRVNFNMCFIAQTELCKDLPHFTEYSTNVSQMWGYDGTRRKRVEIVKIRVDGIIP